MGEGQEPIVRHEAAEALAVIGGEEALEWVKKYQEDPSQEVRETCQLALAKLNLRQVLDEDLPLFDRYRAMFSLRNIGDDESIYALAAGLQCSSALFRHEIAFVLGQVASPLASEQLLTRLRDENENPMVRHECAEALGDIPGVEIEAEMAKYLDPKVDPVVRESCVIALDMADYNNSKEFHYTNGLSSINIPA